MTLLVEEMFNLYFFLKDNCLYIGLRFSRIFNKMIEKKQLKLEHIKLSSPKAEQAYEAIYHMVFADLLRFALSIVHSLPVAEEVVSDVLIQLWRKRATLTEVVDLQLYLYTSTKNTALNYLKSKKLGLLQVNGQLSIDWDKTDPSLKSNDLDPEALIEFAELNRKVTKAIEELPAKCRQVYCLVKQDGLKYKDVACLLKLSLKTVEAQMAIAFKKLHEALGH